MTDDTFLSIVWRRKAIVVGTMVLFAVVSAAVSVTLAKVYETSATLLIAQPSNAQTYDAVQAAQVSARTYGQIVTSPNIAQLVADRIPGATRAGLVGEVSATPVAETQLLQITVADHNPARAKLIADTYASVFNQYVATRLTPVTRVAVSLADAAPLPSSPSKPNPKLYVLLAALLGLGVGVALAFLRHRLDSRVRGFEDLEAEFELPVLARIPRRGRSDASAHAFTDAFRLLRTNLQFAQPDHPPRTLAVTSARAGEGKSTTVTQLAMVSATAGGQVTVVEADIKRPSQQSFFRPDADGPLSPGLTALLVGGGDLQEAMHPTGMPSISLVPSGPHVPSLANLLESPHGRQVIDELGESSDLTLLDCPPLGVGADAATVAGRVDAVVLVVDMETATRESVRDGMRQLEAVRANVVGLVLNRDRSVTETSYGYGYGQGDAPTARLGR